MIEKKISYDINIEKPSKTKPVKQGGVLNYLGKQKTVSAPRRWRSSADHPIAHLAYITKDEEKILIDLNLYGSLKDKPNKGPSGIMSLQGSGSGSGGDSGGQGDSGPGGSDDGTGHGGPGPGSTGGPGAEGGFGIGPDAESEATASNAAAAAAAAATAEGGFGIGPDAATEAAQSAAQSISADDVSAQAQADQEDAATAAAAEAADTGIMGTVNAAVRNAIQNAINNPVSTVVGMAFGPVAGLAARAISSAVDAANRGVTGPSDDTQESSSVQSGPAQSPGGDGGITTLVPTYAPLVNQSTGDPLLDSLIARYRIDPSAFGIT